MSDKTLKNAFTALALTKALVAVVALGTVIDSNTKKLLYKMPKSPEPAKTAPGFSRKKTCFQEKLVVELMFCVENADPADMTDNGG